MTLQSALNYLLHGGDNFCCLCFKTVGCDNILHINDEVVTELGNSDSKEIQQILCLILGPELVKTVISNKVICEECTRSAMTSYNFIKMCKYNTQNLHKVIHNLANAIETIDHNCEANSKSLYVSLNLSGFPTNVYYDDKKSVTSKEDVYKRFLDSIKQRKEENYFAFDHEHNSYLEDDNVKIFKKEKRSKKKISKRTHEEAVTVKTEDIIHEGNKTQCKFCMKVMMNANQLRHHYYRLHAPKTFLCPECPKKFGKPSLVKEHISFSHTPVVCSQCGKMYNNRKNLECHEQSHKGKLICQKCGKSYKSRFTLRVHVCQSTTSKLEKLFACNDCDKKFGRKSSLKNHIQFAHDGRFCICPYCNKKWPHESALKLHLVTHTQEKNFPCEICGDKFVSKASLLYHTRIHTGEKPYPCGLCDKSFLSTSRRMDHIRFNHREPQHECKICKSKFRSTACLRRHEKRHFNPKSKLYSTATDKKIS